MTHYLDAYRQILQGHEIDQDFLGDFEITPQAADLQAFNPGYLGAIVWPTYLGIASGDPGPGPVPAHEPFDEPGYERGQIHWRTEKDGRVLGRARVHAPTGVYTHFVFAYGPIREMMAGSIPLEQPIFFDRWGYIDVDPIENQVILPRV